MLYITVPETELFDDINGQFIHVKETKLQLEHSLVSLSKWESKWHKPYLNDRAKTDEEVLDYVRCMTITQNVNPYVYHALTSDNLVQIANYIDDPMTATTIHKTDNGKGKKINNKQITSELIYYWMVALQIPFKCEKWHLNRLITLIEVCNVENNPDKNTNKKDIARSYAAMNAARRKRLNSKG